MESSSTNHMESSRFTRTLKLINLLQSGLGVSLDYLARSLKCSKRTVFRDIKLLNHNNIRVWYDDRLGGYTADQQLWAVISSLERDELVSLLLAAYSSPVARLEPFSDKVAQAVARMMSFTSAERRRRINCLIKGVRPAQVEPTPDSGNSAIFLDLVETIVDRRRIVVRWKDGRRAAPLETVFSPYRLTVDEGRWVVVGRSTMHRKVVTLPVTDIRSVQKTEKTFQIPAKYLRDEPRRKRPRSKSRK